jgi:sulfur carrier protein ThiS
MKITVEILGKKRKIEVPEKAKVIDAVKKINVNPETVIVKRGKEILLEDEALKKNDEIELIKIVSGG